jgi:hypothetical protein
MRRKSNIYLQNPQTENLRAMQVTFRWWGLRKRDAAGLLAEPFPATMSTAPSAFQIPATVDLPRSGGTAAVSVSRSAAGAVRSLGWELRCLREAARLLAARVRNETLTPALVQFLTTVLAESAGDHDTTPGESFSLRMMVHGDEARVPPDALRNAGVPPRLLALLHLPALRGFWERALRRSHFNRLRRVLPRAWFVTADPPPAGAVVPGLGITAWDRLANDATFLRVPLPGGEIVIEDAKVADAIPLVAHYEQVDGRVNLRAAA